MPKGVFHRSNPVIAIKYSKDDEGIDIALVPIVNSTDHAIIYKSDLDWLIANGYSLKLYRTSSTSYQVRCHVAKLRQYLAISRILVNAGKNQRVDFKNKDNKDLRRSNLIVTNRFKTKGTAKTRARPKAPKEEHLKHIKESN